MVLRGLQGSGKTTTATRLAEERGAVRFCRFAPTAEELALSARRRT